MQGIRISAAFLVAAVLTLAAGCASSSHGTKLDPDKVAQIQRGTTTRADLERMFGPPASVSLMGDGRRQMLYQYMETDTHVKGTSFIPFAGAFMGGSEGTTRQQQLQVILTRADVVEDFVMNDGTSNVDVSHGFGKSSISSTPGTPPPADAK